jgi:hypothetical protein
MSNPSACPNTHAVPFPTPSSAGAPVSSAPPKLGFRNAWRNVLLPALLDDRDEALAALARVEKTAPPEHRGRVLSISARALFVLGDTSGAMQRFEEAMELGGAEAEALAIFLRPDGRHWAERRFQHARDAGTMADAACDAVALCLRDADDTEARRLVRIGLLICPDHGELGRWRRFLTQFPTDAVVALVTDRMRSGGKNALACMARLSEEWAELPLEIALQDAANLAPCASSGWISPERVTRKLANGVLDEIGPAGSALAALQAVGCSQRHYASDAEFAKLTVEHPLVGFEILADRLESLLDEGRPAVATAHELWVRSRRFTNAVTEATASLLASNAFNCEAIADSALLGVRWALKQHPTRRRGGKGSSKAAYWEACRARLLVTVGRREEARKLALPLCQSHQDEPETWLLALDALRLSGDLDTVRRLLFTMQDHASLGDLARELWRTWDTVPGRA